MPAKKKIPTLRELRDGIGRAVPPPPMTQHQVAVQAGVRQSSISNIESGRDVASERLLYRLAGIYGITYHEILASAKQTLQEARAQ